MTLQPPREHPRDTSDKDIDVLFTKDSPIIFSEHGNSLLLRFPDSCHLNHTVRILHSMVRELKGHCWWFEKYYKFSLYYASDEVQG